MREEFYKRRSNELRVAKVFWIAFLGGVPFYFFLLYYLKSINATATLNPEILSTFAILLGFVGALDLVFAFYYPRIIQKFRKDLPPWHSVYIIRLALVEAIAIYGLLIGFMGANWEFAIPFFIASGGGIFLLYPSEEKLGISKSL
ncbi:MAG: hypothetical protein KAU16_03965 [Methanophagales archaeon]|nr:hypothetical protein [Methanophagales archaeon]